MSGALASETRGSSSVDPTAESAPLTASSSYFWPEPDAEANSLWWVLRTRSRQEKAVALSLRASGLTHYLPLVSADRNWGGRKAKVDVPLFPGYVFMQGVREDTFTVDRARRIASILEVEDQSGLHAELVSLRQAIALGIDFDPYPYLKHGSWAEVKSGPYQGLRGLVDRRSKSGKMIIQIAVLQSALALNLDGAMLTWLGDMPNP